MTLPAASPILAAARYVLVLLGAVIAPAALAATLTITPGMGANGATVAVRAQGLAPSTTYTLEFAAATTTNIGSMASGPTGKILVDRVLPALPAGTGKMRLRSGSIGPIVAVTAFRALGPMTFTPQAGRVHAGQSMRFTVGNLNPGTLTVLYEGSAVVGPVAVTTHPYDGKFVIPTDRPPTFPANARIVLQNRVGRVVVSQLQTTLAVSPPLTNPFSLSFTQPPPPSSKPGQRFAVSGSVALEANEAPPEQVSLWFFGDNGDVYPLGGDEPTVTGGQLRYGFEGNTAGSLSMTAGSAQAGSTSAVAPTENSLGMRTTIVDGSGARYNPLPDDLWRLTVRVVKPDGTPVVGAIVQFEGAPVAEESTGLGSIHEYVQTAQAVNQLLVFRATDDQGCPLSLGRQLTDATGRTEFNFTDDELNLALVPFINCGPTGCETIPRTLRLGIDASAQGFGFTFASGPNAGDFLPHIYQVQFIGVGDGDPDGDEIVLIDDYQTVEVARGSRIMNFQLSLPPIEQRVVLFDTSIVPWIGHSFKKIVTSGGQTSAADALRFGPVFSQRGVNPAWIIEVVGQAYPTTVAVRTDPAVTGVVTSARLFLDLNRNGTPEQIGTFTPSQNQLDCSIDGLDKTITWRANLPNVRQQLAGNIDGFIEFIGTPQSGQARKYLRINMREQSMAWLADAQYSAQRQVVYGAGGQNLSVHAAENTPDAAVELPNDPGYEIGKLRNSTQNSRMIDLFIDATDTVIVDAPLDGSHREAGRLGAPTSLDKAPGESFGFHETLIDQSFPLFYYVWGVPILAGIEVGANFSILAELEVEGSYIVKQQTKQPALTVTTTPSLDLGLDFYVDIDVLFDLVDGGVNLTAVFGLKMPVVVTDGMVESPGPCFTTTLIFSWHFEVFCLPLDFVCDAINDIEGSETLLNESSPRSCANGSQSMLADTKGGGSDPAIIRPMQTAVDYSPSGAGFMAFTRDDSNGGAPPVLVVRPVDGGMFDRNADDVVLSSAPGIRSVAVEFYDDNLAVLVWAESADDYPTLVTRTAAQRLARQRLMYSHFDGETWSTKAALTPVAGGEGGVDLASCREASNGDCAAVGEVLAVWTRDMAGDITQHRTRVYRSRYLPTRGWTSPQAVDATAVLDSAPSAAYVNGEPVVAFVRSTSGVFGDTDARRIAYRFVGGSAPVQVPAGLPGGAAWPSIVGLPDGGFAIAYTHADDPRAFVGNTQRLALATGSACVNGACAIAARPVTDSLGRAIYGERPQVLLDVDGEPTVVMRGMGFGTGINGSNVSATDPIGMTLHTGELISTAIDLDGGIAEPMPISSDGAGHFAPSAAFDTELGQIVALSSRGSSIPSAMRAKYRAGGARPTTARAKAIQAEPGIDAFGVATGVDFAIESIVLDIPGYASGDTMRVEYRVRNVGAPYTSQSPAYLARLNWDAPHGAGGLPSSSRSIPSLDSGQAVTLVSNVAVPTGFALDQTHRLYANVVRGTNPVDDVNGANDQRFEALGGVPMPTGLNASAVPGTGLVQLTWDAVADPYDLVAGFRVWHHDGDGQWRHLGSSFELGFLDLSASVGVTRQYRVTAYSENAIESEPSDAANALVVVAEDLFADGFE